MGGCPGIGGISKCWCHFRASIIEFFSIFVFASDKSCIPMGGGGGGGTWRSRHFAPWLWP